MYTDRYSRWLQQQIDLYTHALDPVCENWTVTHSGHSYFLEGNKQGSEVQLEVGKDIHIHAKTGWEEPRHEEPLPGDDDLFKYTRYINLASRQDRRRSIERQVAEMDIPATRFDAIRHENGALGCVQSHISILEQALSETDPPPYVCVFEDDALFLTPVETKKKAMRVHRRHADWDVILLGGNNFPPFHPVDDDCARVANCQTTHAYIVKYRFIPTLIENFKHSQTLLSSTQDGGQALDQQWKHLQRQFKFLLLYPVAVDQLEGFSDITGEHVSYDLISPKGFADAAQRWVWQGSDFKKAIKMTSRLFKEIDPTVPEPGELYSLMQSIKYLSKDRGLYFEVGTDKSNIVAYLQSKKLWHGITVKPERAGGFPDDTLTQDGKLIRRGSLDTVLDFYAMPRSFDVLFVSDGLRDQSWHFLSTLVKYRPQFVVLQCTDDKAAASSYGLAMLPAYTFHGTWDRGVILCDSSINESS